MPPTRPISSSVFAITGGARGIGRATAAAVVREGGHVAIGDVDLATARATAEELGPLVSAYEVDVTERASFARFLDEVEAGVGPVDVLVNNAGIMPLGPFVEETDATAHRQIDINVHGVLYGMKEAIPRMLARGRGHVINIASGAGKAGYPGGATYCATKHAVVGVSDAVRAELKKTPVEISTVFPAVVNTELAAGVTRTRGIKVVEPEDVADAILAIVRQPRPEVYIPRELGPTIRVMQVMPRVVRDLIVRALRGDRVLSQIDQGQRRVYDERLLTLGSGGQAALPPGDATGAGEPAALGSGPPNGSGNGLADADGAPAGGDPVGTTTTDAGR